MRRVAPPQGFVGARNVLALQFLPAVGPFCRKGPAMRRVAPSQGFVGA